MLKARSRDKEPTQLGEGLEVWRDDVQNLPIETIRPNPFQPRRRFAEETLRELADSIAEHGVLHPVLVRAKGSFYELVVGERRLRACQILGWETIPAVLRVFEDREMAEIALIENLQRRDLDFFEEAEGYRRLLEEFQLTQGELAERLSKSQSSIANRLRLLKLAPEVREAISREILSERHARALLMIEDPSKQMEVIKEIIQKELNVKQTEEFIRQMGLKEAKVKKPKQNKSLKSKDLHSFSKTIKELTNSLRSEGMEVDVDEDDQGGFYRLTVLVKKPEGRDR